ncbi:hypothetical protein DFR70_104648 [Nocardia tenerifensis]|uniref:Uncharacterized protein n=2 Tax=Nocardia tenerifensis TaxID=228006 RepID=A0A318KG92_9NOCA|nr:hypothetical protein DFR70_104648 [Nocardia tenerifensis]
MFTRVDRSARAYADEELHRFLAQKWDVRRREGEQALLDSFTKHVEAIVAKYDPPGIRRRSDSLLFARGYARLDQTAGPSGQVSPEVLVALFAAEVEYRGPLRLSRTQSRRLAEVYELIGTALAPVLPSHAALAFQRAWSLFRQDGDTDAEDRCGLSLARARRRAQPIRWRRGVGYFSDLVCGYGYRPYRMLLWIVLQVGLSIVIVRWLSTASTVTVVYDCAMNYLNPLSSSDTAGLQGAAQLVFVVQAYAGVLSTSVFFALLVRRWFRL